MKKKIYILNYKNKKDKTNYEFKEVSFIKNINKFLYKIYSENSHRNALSLREELLNRNYYYKGIVDDTIKVVKECSKYILKSNVDIKHKREKTKVIIFKCPKTKFIGDLTEIPNELKINSKYLYQVIIIDHFSKFVNSYLFEKKKACNILEKLKPFFAYYGEPKEFVSDKGKEFLNSAV